MEEEVKEENVEKRDKITFGKVLYQIVFWIISILAYLLFIRVTADKPYAGILYFIGGVGINPLFHLLKFKKFNKKKFHHIRRSISGIILVIAFILSMDEKYESLNKQENIGIMLYRVSDKWEKSIDEETDTNIYKMDKNTTLKVTSHPLDDNSNNFKYTENILKFIEKENITIINDVDYKKYKKITATISGDTYEIIIYSWIENNYCDAVALYQKKSISEHNMKELSNICDTVQKKNITLSESENITLAINTKRDISVRFEPSEYKEGVVWNCEDENIVKIQEQYDNGQKITINTINNGTTTLTATTKDTKLSRKIVINVYTPVETISLDKTDVVLHKGETNTLNLTITPDGAKDTPVTWSSDDISIADVKNGVVTANSLGNAKITASTKDGKSATCNVSVVDLTEAEYKALCSPYTYEQLSRNPDSIRGNKVKVTGEVVQALYSTYGSSVDLRVDITKQGYYSTYYTDTIYVTYYPSAGENRILENDIITIWGTASGTKTYTSVLKVDVTLPYISAKYIQINKK